MAGASPWHDEQSARTRAKVVAVELGEQVIVEFEDGFVVQPDDAVFICGSIRSLERYQQAFNAGAMKGR